jgi:hypothetical protein
VPREQLAQCCVVACRQGRDQLVVVHHHVYCAQPPSGSSDAANSRWPPSASTWHMAAA